MYYHYTHSGFFLTSHIPNICPSGHRTPSARAPWRALADRSRLKTDWVHLRTSPRLQREWTLRRPCAPASRVSKPSRACRIGNSSWSRRGTDTGNSSPFPRSPCGAPHGCASLAMAWLCRSLPDKNKLSACSQVAGSTAPEDLPVTHAGAIWPGATIITARVLF